MAEHATMIACRLPDALIDDARRYAALYHSDLSKLLREGLTYRLCFKSWPPIPSRDMPPGTLPPHVDTLLHDLATHLDQVRSELADSLPSRVGVPNGETLTEEQSAYDGITTAVQSQGKPPAGDASSRVQYADDLEDMPLHPEPLPDADDVAATDLEKRPLAPESAQRPLSVVPPPATCPPGHYFGAPCQAHGHVSHGDSPSGEPQNQRNPAGKCVMCEDEKKAARKAAQQPA